MARELGMNVSQTVDALLAEEVRRRYWARRNADNKGAIDAYNERIECDGLPLAKYRAFAKGQRSSGTLRRLGKSRGRGAQAHAYLLDVQND
jgi:antitoxin CcdA